MKSSSWHLSIYLDTHNMCPSAHVDSRMYPTVHVTVLILICGRDRLYDTQTINNVK